jgi:CubicO group peptidase (beta-lactamase class C family)
MPSWPAATSLMIVALSAAASTVDAQPGAAIPDDPKPQLSPDSVAAIDASMERVVQNFYVPGLAIGIVEDGVPVYVRAFGVRDLDSGQPVNVHTLFHVASLTKTFTAAAIMQLVEQNRLALTDQVGRHLPAFAASPITITQLLTHSAGLKDVNHASATDDLSAVTAYVAKIASRKPSYPPGQGWEYSDSAFNVLGATIESVAQQPFPQYLKTNVLAAAGMGESTFAAPDPGSNIAWPHTGKVFVRRASNYPWDRALLPSAGLNASIADMTRWAAAHVNRDPALLSPASYDSMFQHRLDSGWQGIAMGLGWQLEKRGDDLLPRHAGNEHGFSALLTLYPEHRRAIVILSNGETTPRGEIRDLIEAVMNGEEFISPSPPLLLRRDFQWSLAGLAGMTLLLIAVTVRFRRRSPR